LSATSSALQLQLQLSDQVEKALACIPDTEPAYVKHISRAICAHVTVELMDGRSYAPDSVTLTPPQVENWLEGLSLPVYSHTTIQKARRRLVELGRIRRAGKLMALVVDGVRRRGAITWQIMLEQTEKSSRVRV
jgi:hypothetical protein